MAHSIQRVHFVELNAKLNTLETKPVFPQYGTPLLATILKQRGYEVQIYLEGVSNMDLEQIARCDVICMPVFAPAHNKVKALVERLRKHAPCLPIIMGGPHVCLYTETVLEMCDYAVRCEGDEALPELLDCLAAGGDVRRVQGISFIEQGQVVHTPDRPPPFIPSVTPDMTLIEGFDRAARGVGRRRIVNTLQTSRGCTFRCRFCPTSRLFGGVYRNRDIDSIVAEIRAKLAYNPFFFVVDNSFLSNRERTAELLRRLAREQLGAHLIIFERHEIGKDTELLQLMRRAGVRCIIVGIESLSDANLRSYNKEQTTHKVRRSIESILEHDIHVIGTFVMGADGDTPQSGAEITQFVLETGISPNLFVMHDVEEDESRKLLIPLDRRFRTYYRRSDPTNTDYLDYGTGNFVTYFPRHMRPTTLQRSVLEVYRQLFSHRNTLRRMLARNPFASVFGVDHGFSMRRLNDVIGRVVDDYYLAYLEQVEQGLYDGDDLVQERLDSLRRLPLPRPLDEGVDHRRFLVASSIFAVPGLIRLWRQDRRRQTEAASVALAADPT